MKNKTTVLLIVLLLSSQLMALPPQIELDRLLLQTKTALDSKNYVQAKESLDKAEKLGIKLPDTFYYHSGVANVGSQNYEQAQIMFERYLDMTGNKGKYYRESLENLNFIEVDKANYLKALEQRKSDIEKCESEHKNNIKSLEQEAERLYQKCHNYGEYDCGQYREKKAEKLWKRWQDAEERKYDAARTASGCEQRYPVPTNHWN